MSGSTGSRVELDTLDGLERVDGEPVEGTRVFNGRCPICRAGVSVACTLETVRDMGWQVRSGCHARWTVLAPLQAVSVPGRRCDSRCTNAVGSSCECECAGLNHGARFRVGVTR